MGLGGVEMSLTSRSGYRRALYRDFSFRCSSYPVSQQLHRERILDVADLAAMPKGRAVVLASGARPTLVRTQPWMTGPHAAAVRASIAAHDPQAERTIREAQTELAAVAAVDDAQEAS